MLSSPRHFENVEGKNELKRHDVSYLEPTGKPYCNVTKYFDILVEFANRTKECNRKLKY